ncbi:PREDICTED: mitochondrial import inner membrane translocase subunit Tim21-like [Acropora digitifera]|uniref:mitochondrial import inner membrane translocase subunit Tim21-like n=1 Tax=Acropora digitifera TaxID=70779 RepID=UPI00077AA3C7|nr:PREDICTED: mitochondrial import inner membrane translocase subunit Tim21-like [Acropora digitifera]
MFTWKSLARIVPKCLSSTVVIARKARQNSSFPLAFRKCRLLTHGIAWQNDYPNQYCLYIEPITADNFGHAVRFRSDRASREKKDSSVLQDLVETREQPQTQLTVGAKVAQAGKDATYFGIILIGFGITGCGMAIYSTVTTHSLVIEAVGEPIMGHGETTSRGRRRNVSYQEYLVDGENYMRVKFYIKGSNRKGTVHVDVKQASRGNFDYRFIFVELSPYETIIVLDNR